MSKNELHDKLITKIKQKKQLRSKNNISTDTQQTENQWQWQTTNFFKPQLIKDISFYVGNQLCDFQKYCACCQKFSHFDSNNAQHICSGCNRILLWISLNPNDIDTVDDKIKKYYIDHKLIINQ